MHKKTLITGFIFISIIFTAHAQDSTHFYFTTSAGLLVPVNNFSNAYQTSLALNSGVEYKINHSLFAQFVLDFNAVKYSQRYQDDNSTYLFQKTNSSIFLAGFNFGKNFSFSKISRLFSSVYTGAGYVNIGEPRLNVNLNNNIVEQSVKRMPGVFVKSGLRLGYKTSSSFLQTIYIDGSYWTTNITVQQSKAQAVSLYIGTRIGF
ncbi:hypothetical protein [Ferruginibacter sp.]